MLITDFSRSFFTFRIDLAKRKPKTVSRPVPFTVNNARMPIECVCDLTPVGGTTTRYVLGASCKAEQVNVQRDVWHDPNADMTMIASESVAMIVKSWDRNNKGVKLYPAELGDQPERQIERVAEAFDRLSIALRTTEARELATPDAVVEATLGNRVLVSRTEWTAGDGTRVAIEYPVKCINASERDHYYQTDTGPVLWYDPQLESADPIGRLRQAFIAHNSPSWAELIVNVPTQVVPGVSVNHYSRSVRLEGTVNRVFECAD